jgi:hypothetical protein
LTRTTGTLDIDLLQQSTGLSKAFLFAAGLAALYLCFLTSTHYWDGVLFSLYIEKAAEGAMSFPALFHPNHLLYSPAGYVVFRSLHAVGFALRAITALQLVNVLASVLCSALIFRLGSRLLHSKELQWSCTLLFALGATWWKFSTDADSYVLAVSSLTGMLFFLLRERPRLVPAGVCLAMAMLFHQLAILGYAPVFVALGLERRSAGERIRRVMAFSLVTAVPVAIAYYCSYRSTHSESSIQAFLGWVLSVSSDTKTTHSFSQLVPANLSSYVKLFAGGKLSLVRNFLSFSVVVTLLIASVCLAMTIISFFQTQRPSPVANLRMESQSAPPILWSSVAIYFLFLSWFEPGNAFYKLFLWPAIVLLLGYYLDRRGQQWKRAFTWFALGLGAWNFAAFIYPHSKVAADPVLALALQLDREMPQSATVYYQALSPDDWYLEYFAPGRRWEMLPDASKRRHGSAAAPVCFETTALAVVQIETNPRLRWSLVNNQHNVRIACATE